MANITLRQSSGNTEPRLANVSISNTPLTNVQLDNNFNNLNNDVNSRLSKSGGEVAGNLTISGNTIINSATVSEVHTKDLDLQAVSTTLHRSPNAITAMFIYATQFDSDGGAWTEKCQHTSWYSEPINGKWLGAQRNETEARCTNAVIGPELVTNGSFNSDLSGWNLNQTDASNTITWENGRARIVSNGSKAVSLSQSILTVGKTYKVDITVVVNSGNGVKINIPTVTETPLNSSGTYSFYLYADAPSFSVSRFGVGQATDTFIDNISVREVTATTTAANDYFQLTTDGKFYALSKNLLTSTATLATQTQWLTAGTYTLSSTTGSSGSVAISGAATASHTAGTPATFTVATSGNVTFTVTGSVLTAQCELGSVATTYSANTSTTRYNEVFRGNKRSFPKLAAIVAEASNVTIYDLTEAGRPMWMRFNHSFVGAWPTISALLTGTGPITGVQMQSGRLCVSTTGNGLLTSDFLKDNGIVFITSETYIFSSVIQNRNTTIGKYIKSASFGIINNDVNAVAMTVLPDAPVDHCLIGDTLVSMADGSYKRIDEVKVGDVVNTLEGISTVKRWLDQGVRETITLTFDNGITLTCTPDHEIRTTVGWIEAQNLTEDHEIIHE